ncbi:hypothetical protein DYY66_2071 [Candidatus Nitrosotalea sp. FS]|nr:hypothetical protein [Candidatus Nitrosotalea sp. FS]
MISQEITINGKKYRLTLTDQVLSDVRRLKALYNAAYEDPESFDEVSSAISNTITQIAAAVEPEVSDSDLDGLTLTDQVLSDVRRLKALYNAAYEDPESFDEVSSAISNTITQIASAVEPEVSDSDLDGLIQAVMKAVDEKSKETEEAKAKHLEDKAKASKKPAEKPKKSKK